MDHDTDDTEPALEDDKVKPIGSGIYADSPPAPLPPIAPDGGFAVVEIEPPAPVPPATPELFICLRGPCRHYWEIEAYFESGNPADIWEELGLPPPRQIHRTCKAHPGTETELTEGLVYACNLWDPLEPEELVQLDARRRRYYERNPTHRPADEDSAILAPDDQADPEEADDAAVAR